MALLLAVLMPSAAEAGKPSLRRTGPNAFGPSNHAAFQEMASQRGDLFPEARGYVELRSVPSTALTTNRRRGNVVAANPYRKGSTLEFVDPGNARGFTALRYEEVFHDLGAALGVVAEGVRREVVTGGPTQSAVSRASWTNMIRPGRAELQQLLPQLDALAAGPNFSQRVRLLELLTGVKVDLGKDLRMRSWGPPRRVPVLLVTNPDRIFSGLTRAFVAPSASERAELAGLLRQHAPNIEGYLTASSNLTEAEKNAVRLRVASFGVGEAR